MFFQVPDNKIKLIIRNIPKMDMQGELFMKKVVIIGGGIIGLSSAYYLKKAGMDVTVIEKEELGKACSQGNQGWVCPALHEPVPAPGLMTESFKMLLQRDSPLYIKPTAMPQLSSWLSQFMKYCNECDFRAGEAALLTLSQSTLSLFDSLQQEGIKFELHRKGILFAFLSQENLQKKFKRFEEVARVFGHEQPVLKNSEEIQEIEPSLSTSVQGGILLTEQYHVRPESLAQGIVNKLKEMGVNLYLNTEVVDLEREDDRIVSIKTKSESINSDYFLLAAGAWSGTLAKKMGYTLPLTGGKGYSITIQNPSTKINRPLYLGDLKTGITPFNEALRMGGTMELSGINTTLDRKRIQGIRSAVSKYLKEDIKGDKEDEWVGMRPMTPDGLPVLGKVPKLNNMYIATGHGMVGVAMAPATGKILSELIVSGETEFKISPFAPSRFGEGAKLYS